MPKETAEPQYLTIQNDEGIYEARVAVADSNNFPLQTKLRITRYRIPEPPRLMRNIPKFYTSKELLRRHVLKFDIRDPRPNHQLWKVGKCTQENPTRECIIETHEQQKKKHTESTERKSTKRTTETGNNMSAKRQRTL